MQTMMYNVNRFEYMKYSVQLTNSAMNESAQNVIHMRGYLKVDKLQCLMNLVVLQCIIYSVMQNPLNPLMAQ